MATLGWGTSNVVGEVYKGTLHGRIAQIGGQKRSLPSICEFRHGMNLTSLTLPLWKMLVGWPLTGGVVSRQTQLTAREMLFRSSPWDFQNYDPEAQPAHTVRFGMFARTPL